MRRRISFLGLKNCAVLFKQHQSYRTLCTHRLCSKGRWLELLVNCEYGKEPDVRLDRGLSQFSHFSQDSSACISPPSWAAQPPVAAPARSAPPRRTQGAAPPAASPPWPRPPRRCPGRPGLIGDPAGGGCPLRTEM